MTNGELLVAFRRAMDGKLKETTIAQYANNVEDAMRYFQRDGQEVPVRKWKKADV